MIDTIKIKIETDELPENYTDHLQSVLGGRQIEMENGMTKYRGLLKNMQVTLDNWGLTIEGSLTKYAVGDNLKSAELLALVDAVYDIGGILKVDLGGGEVKRLDIAGNIRTIHPVAEYYPFLVDLSKHVRNELHNGLSFSNSLREVSFYGKIKEMKRKRDVILDGAFKHENILRFECRTRSRGLRSFLKNSKPTVNDIISEYYAFVEMWQATFNSITKKGVLYEPSSEIFTRKGAFDKFLMAKGVEALGGLEGVLKMIKFAKGRGEFKKYPNASTNLRARMKSLMETPHLVEKSDLIKELEDKVTMVARCAYFADYFDV